MKAVTASRLSDGVVVYVGPNGAFVERLAHAQLFDDAEAETALAEISNRRTEIASAYLIDAASTGPVGREALRESIRAHGPTIRRDLGKQAEAIDERL